MKFIKQLNQADDAQPPISKPVPMVPKTSRCRTTAITSPISAAVARRLGVSKRFVQVACAPEGNPSDPARPALHPVRPRQRHDGRETKFEIQRLGRAVRLPAKLARRRSAVARRDFPSCSPVTHGSPFFGDPSSHP